VPFVERILYVSGPPGEGQVYREQTRLLGIRDAAEWRIVEWDPPRRQVQVSTDKGMDAQLVIEVEPLEPLDAGRSRLRRTPSSSHARADRSAGCRSSCSRSSVAAA
jgi:hypothetical protein